MKIKKLTGRARIPQRAHSTDAGLDVFSMNDVTIPPESDFLFPLGWSCEIPNNWTLIVKEKSGLATKKKITIGACVIDSGYRGEIMIHLFNNSKVPVEIREGDKIAQVILVPCWTGQPEEVNDISETPRGSGGFGSTGL